MGLDRSANWGGMTEEVDLSWAYERAAHSADVSDSNVLVGSCDYAPPEEAGAHAARLEPRPPGVATDHSVPLEGSLAEGSGREVNGMSEPARGPGLLREDVDGRGGEVNGMSEPVGKSQDFTIEPKLDDLVESTQSVIAAEVATDFDSGPGLDNVARKVSEVDGSGRTEGGGRRAEGGESESGDDGGKAVDGEQREKDAREQAAKGNAMSASLLIEEDLWSSQKGGSEVHGSHSRSP